MRALGIAFHMYAAEHDDRIPAGADALLEAEFIGVDALQSSFGPAADGGADYWLDDSGGKMSDIRYPDKRVLAYDRAMYLDGRQVAALFADGHVRREREDGAAQLFDLGSRLGHSFPGLVRDHELGTRLGEDDRGGAADAAGGARHDSDPIGQVEGSVEIGLHGCSPGVAWRCGSDRSRPTSCDND